MSTKLKMESLTVMSFFNKKSSIYIPDYQRAYSWSKNQLEQWVTDLREIVEADQQYYLGRILLEGPDDKNRFAVVDGQQRLTTIFLFLWAMKNKKVDLSELNCKFGNWIKRFQIANVDSSFFTRQMKSERILKKTDTNSQKLILEAIECFQKLKKVDRKALTEALLNAQLPTITVKGKRDAALMFQLENDRGVLLTQMEKLKAYLMYEAIISTGDEHTDVLDIISEKFEEIGRICFTIREKPDSILRAHYRACLTGSRNPYHDYSLDVIKEHLRGGFTDNIRDGIEKLCNELLISFEAIQNLEELDYEIYTEYFQFFTIPDYVLPILLVSYRKDIFEDEDESKQLLNILGKLILRQEFVASQNARQTDIKTKIRLGSILEKFRNSDEENALEQLVEQIESGFEEWQVKYRKNANSKLWTTDKFNDWLGEGYYPDSIAKFFLFMYEIHKRKGSVDIKKNWTLEHISPQSKNERTEDGWATADESYKRRQKELDKLEDDGYIQCIGNLCLLEKNANSRASNKSFEKKREIYEDEDSLLHVQKISSFATDRKKLWAIEAIDNRNKKLIEFITKQLLNKLAIF